MALGSCVRHYLTLSVTRLLRWPRSFTNVDTRSHPTRPESSTPPLWSNLLPSTCRHICMT